MRANHLVVQKPDEPACFAKHAVGSPHTTWPSRVGPQADEASAVPMQREPDLADGERVDRQVVVCIACGADQEEAAQTHVPPWLTRDETRP